MRTGIVLLAAGVSIFTSGPCFAAGPASMPASRPQEEIVGIEALRGRKDALELLNRNHFVVTGEAARHIDSLYEPMLLIADVEKFRKDVEAAEANIRLDADRAHEWLRGTTTKSMLPPLVTTDALLHAYGVLYGDSLKALEANLAIAMKEWQQALWDRLASTDAVASLLSKDELAHLIGLVSVGCKLTDPNWSPGQKPIPKWVESEVNRILKSEGAAKSEGWRQNLEYSAFRPRGFYAGDDALERYFRARVWWSVPFFDGRDDAQLRMALELAMACSRCRQTARLTRAASRLIGSAEDPSAEDLWECAVRVALPKAEEMLDLINRVQASGAFDEATGDILGNILGEPLDPARLKASLPEIRKRLARDFRPTIRTGIAKGDGFDTDPNGRIYVLPRAYVVDGDILSLTTAPPFLNSRLPSGLDVMAALAGEPALGVLLEDAPKVSRDPLRGAIQQAAMAVANTSKPSQVTTLTYRVLESLLKPQLGAAHPPFMKTEAYLRKSLQTALAGWAEHRYRWVLHAKPSGGIFGDPPPLEAPPGFVEPNPEFWQRLIDLTVATQKALADAGAPQDRRWTELAATSVQCRLITEAQLAGKELSEDQKGFFASFHKTIARLCLPEGETEHGNSSQAVVADVHRELTQRKVIHVGTGLPQTIYAVYPYRGRNWLCKGGVMTYREHIAQDGKTLTVQEWEDMLHRLPPPPWVKGFSLPPDIPKSAD